MSATRERPINLRDWQVRAARDGRLSQIWVPMRPQPAHSCRWEMNGNGDKALHLATGPGGEMLFVPYKATSADHRLPCPLGRVGDRVRGREAYMPRYFDDGATAYKADWTGAARDLCMAPSWRSPAVMRTSEARLTFEILSVDVRQVHAIANEDVLCCGFTQEDIARTARLYGPDALRDGAVWQLAFADAWNSAHGCADRRWERRGDCPTCWNSNPWAWKLGVKVIQ